MIFRLLLAMLLLFSVAACSQFEKKQKQKKKEQAMEAAARDVSFQAFLGRLRKAASNRDTQMLASMMAPDFGWRWDDSPPGETPFKYWDANNLWTELSAVVRESWVPHENFLVAPPQFAHEEDYRGFRAGVRRIAGSFKFAYFVPPPPPSAASEPAPPAAFLPQPMPQP